MHSDIADLKAGIDVNKEAILANRMAIDANKEAILANGVAIDANKEAILANGVAIIENKAAILANGVAINANKAAIIENKAAIDREQGGDRCPEMDGRRKHGDYACSCSLSFSPGSRTTSLLHSPSLPPNTTSSAGARMLYSLLITRP